MKRRKAILRQMKTLANEAVLAGRGVKSGLCPRNPKELKERLEQAGQKEGMKRRGGTEARVANLFRFGISYDWLTPTPARSRLAFDGQI